MESDRCRILKENFLEVKFPPNSPDRVLYKAWRKLWASATVLYPRGRGEPHFLLQLMRGPHEKRLQVVKASRDGLRLFRCRSGSRPLRTWALSSGGNLLVYLAAENEKETQMWMQTIRDGLWPPVCNLPGSICDVSLIDDEKSFSSGILGLYGRMVRTADDMVSIIHPHWQGVLLRWKPEDIVDVRLVRRDETEASTFGVFRVTLRGSKKETRTLHFYSNMAISAVMWIQSKSKNSDCLLTNDDNPKEIQHLLHPLKLDDGTSSCSDTSEYAAVRKSNEQMQMIQEDETLTITEKERFKEQSTNSKNQLFAAIPSELLDASINSIMLPNKEQIHSGEENKLSEKEDGDSDDSNIDLYEHVYEDLPSRSPSVGAYTLYEEVEDSESEYVPPLPPQLPNRPIQKPTSIRLQKLSDSVAEALKLAEEVPLLVEQHPRPLLLKKVIAKKSKCLQTSPLRETASRGSEEQSYLKKATMEPDIIFGQNEPCHSKEIHKAIDIDSKSTDNVPSSASLRNIVSEPHAKKDLRIDERPKTNDDNKVIVIDTKKIDYVANKIEGDYLDMR